MNADINRVVLVTLDGVGIGALPDAEDFGDGGAATLQHVYEACGGLDLPHLRSLGLGQIEGLEGLWPAVEVKGLFGRLHQRSAGKDSTAGHWELAGVIQTEPLPVYPNGFPNELIDAFKQQTGISPLGNIAASGTEIIEIYGAQHLRTGRPILYTSVDSVLQIAAHEEIISVERLYGLCADARKVADAFRIGRVIARPFVGDVAGGFTRTERRRDFSLPPVAPTVLDRLIESGYAVHGIGKISDLFAGRGLTANTKTRSNCEGVLAILQQLKDQEAGLIFANLIDFDMVYGHRNDAVGFGQALEAFDRQLPQILSALTEDDLLILTADHGCDPTVSGTDHTREYVPLLAWTPRWKTGQDVGTRASMADVATTLCKIFKLKEMGGKSFLGC